MSYVRSLKISIFYFPFLIDIIDNIITYLIRKGRIKSPALLSIISIKNAKLKIKNYNMSTPEIFRLL